LAYDVFISYASKDKIVADAACARLEAAGIRCWIAPRDIVAGTSYGEAIIDAIHGARVMVLVFSSSANSSGHIPKEVERAVSNGVPIIPFRIEDVAPGKSLDYFIGSVHWLDAMSPPIENHLDNLAATVHKLLPADAGGQRAATAQTSGVWQRSGTMAVPQTAPASRTGASGTAAIAAPSSSKRIWIGIAGVAVIIAFVMGVILLRGGGGAGGNGGNGGNAGGNTPGSVNPPTGGSGATNPTPGGNPVAPTGSTDPAGSNPYSGSGRKSKYATPPVSPAARTDGDPIVGCYQWFNNAPVVIRADGSMTGGPFAARWRLMDGDQRKYTFTWPEATDTVSISPDQRSLKGTNQYGYASSATRAAGAGGLIGIWNWSSGVPLTVYPDGTFSAATFRGKWQAIDVSRGIYTLTWPNPVDSVTLSADGTLVSGTNQYGVSISGVKTGNCAGN
jgi:TIR domain